MFALYRVRKKQEMFQNKYQTSYSQTSSPSLVTSSAPTIDKIFHFLHFEFFNMYYLKTSCYWDVASFSSLHISVGCFVFVTFPPLYSLRSDCHMLGVQACTTITRKEQEFQILPKYFETIEWLYLN